MPRAKRELVGTVSFVGGPGPSDRILLFGHSDKTTGRDPYADPAPRRGPGVETASGRPRSAPEGTGAAIQSVFTTISFREGEAMERRSTSIGRSIKVGVVTDQTGPLSFLGIANANVARMAVDEINAQGGVLGRQIEQYLDDSATTDSLAEATAAKLVQQDQVDVVFGG